MRSYHFNAKIILKGKPMLFDGNSLHYTNKVSGERCVTATGREVEACLGASY